jgi:hypothetical protein
MMRKGFVLALVPAILLTDSVVVVTRGADSPLPPPTRQTIWSNNRQFFAITDPKDQTTTVYRATSDGKGIRTWAMYGYLRLAWLADDGEHLVADPSGWWGLLPLDYDKGHVVLYFFKRGELIKYVTLSQVIGDFSKLIRTASHYRWGESVGFDQAGDYVIETVEGRRIRFDLSSGEPAPSTSSKHRDVQPGSKPGASDETTFLGTVTKIDIGNTRHPVLRWVVTLRIDKVINGKLPGETFRLAIHSPSQEGIEPGHQYRMLVRKRGDGYDYSGPHPWLDVLHEAPGPK